MGQIVQMLYQCESVRKAKKKCDTNPRWLWGGLNFIIFLETCGSKIIRSPYSLKVLRLPEISEFRRNAFQDGAFVTRVIKSERESGNTRSSPKREDGQCLLQQQTCWRRSIGHPRAEVRFLVPWLKVSVLCSSTEAPIKNQKSWLHTTVLNGS